MGAGWFPPFPQESTKTMPTLTLNAAVKVLISLFMGIHIESVAGTLSTLGRGNGSNFPSWGNIRHLLLSNCGRKMNFL